MDTTGLAERDVRLRNQRLETERLGTDKILPLVLRLSLPSMIGLVVSSLYSFVDRVFIGRYIGETGLAAMSAALPFTTLIFAFTILIGRGCAVVYSLSLGRGDYDEAGKVFSQGITLYLLASFIIVFFGEFYLRPLLTVFGADSSSMNCAAEYMRVILLGTPFAMLTTHNHLIRAEGASGYSMLTQATGAVLNIILDWCFIHYFRWGMSGAAWATVFSQFISVVMVLWFFKRRSVIDFRIKDLMLRWGIIRNVFYNGATPFLFNIVATLTWTVQNNMIHRYTRDSGYSVDTVMAAFGVVMTIRHIILTPLLGISMGMQPLIGYNHGARKYSRVQRIFLASVGIACLFVLLPYAVSMVFAENVIGFFGAEGEVLKLGVYTMRRYLLLVPIGCLCILFSHYFQGTGQPGKALFLTSVRQIIFAFPFMIALPYFFGLNGIIFAFPVSEVASMFFGLFMMVAEYRHLKNLQREELTGLGVPVPKVSR